MTFATRIRVEGKTVFDLIEACCGIEAIRILALRVEGQIASGMARPVRIDDQQPQ